MSILSDRLRKAVSTQGILAVALDDAIRRGEQHFTLPPSDRELTDWAASLKTSAPHFFPQAPAAPEADGTPPGMPPSVWKSMSPSARLGWWREHHPRPPVQRRPPPFEPSPAQVAQLAAMPMHERVTAFRRMRQEQG